MFLNSNSEILFFVMVHLAQHVDAVYF
jgi:hypothetical protein